MTICVGFHFEDSIVLCSDRQMTKGDLKFYEKKVSAISGAEWSMGFGYAGSRELMGFVFDRAQDKLMGIDPEFGLFRYIMEDIVQEAFQRFPDADLQLLCGITINSRKSMGRQLLMLSRDGVREVDGWEFLGIGDSSLIRYLHDTFTKGLSSDTERLLFAVYMVQQVKGYVEDCSGETDVLILRERDEPHILGRKEIANLETRLRLLGAEFLSAFKQVVGSELERGI